MALRFVRLLPRFALAFCLTLPKLALGNHTYELQTQCQTGDLTHVNVALRVDGTLQPSADPKVPKLELKVRGGFSYDERRVDDCTDLNNRCSIRYYHEAQAAIQVDKNADSPKLRDEQRWISVRATKKSLSISAPHGPLTRDELEMIDLPGNSLVLDRLLPEGAVRIGDTWPITAEPMPALLALDVASQSGVKAELTEVHDDLARIKLAGTVQGAVGGVATEMRLDGQADFDLVHRRLKTVHLIIREKRSLGFVSPGLDVKAQIAIEITPLAGSDQLADAAVKEAIEATKEQDAHPQPLLLESAGHFQLFCDRRWHATRDDAELVVLRYVDRGELVAQGNISPLPNLPAGQNVNLEQFQDEVKRSLGKHFGEFEAVAEGKTSSGLRLLKVFAVGTVSELPIEWRYYLVLDSHGRRAALAFTLEGKLIERFADADAPLVDSLQFTALPEPHTAAPEPREDVNR